MVPRVSLFSPGSCLRLAAVVMLAGLAACAPPAERVGDSRIQVVTTIGMIRDAVENVGGEHVSVTGLMGPGVDPHLYKAREGDVRRLFRADVVFYAGLHLEAKMGEVLEEMGTRTRTVAVSDAVPRESLLAPPEFQGAFDPHLWFDVALWSHVVEPIRATLTELDPAHAADYQRNADAYRRTLAELDAYVQRQAERVPRGRRVLITAHDAFNYFGRAYGFEVRGLQGISTASEAGTGDVQSLSAFITERRIPAVFVESSIPQRNVEAVQEAVRARGWEVRIGGSLFSDAMGTAGTPEGTYVGMVRHNIDTIVGSLLAEPTE